MIETELSEPCSTEVDSKVISGYCSIARKSLLRRWASRCSCRVSMLAAWMTSLTEDWETTSSMCTVPSNSVNCPRTFVTMACRATNPTVVCATSMA